jgi:hypothetical protein
MAKTARLKLHTPEKKLEVVLHYVNTTNYIFIILSQLVDFLAIT